jgi:asparagine synthase (glutamine-hydrolysing)
MFAFAIWDAQRHRLFIARDPMGIKPLYYYESDRYFIFSSEVRTLLGTGLVPREIDGAGLVNYLTFGSLSDPNTLLRSVSALPAANFLIWQDGCLEQKQYWDLAAPADGVRDPDHGGRGEKENQTAEALDESVRMQLISDVPVGVFLSGGIDSSSLAGILARSGVRPSTFSIVFREAEYSEAEYSREVAQHFGTDHHEITVSQSDFFAAIDPALDAMDLPTIDGVNTYFVSEKTRAAGVKVALSGLGGDEVYAGYSSFRTVPRMERFAHSWKHVPEFVRNPASKIFHSITSDTDQNRKLAALARNGTAVVHPYFLSRMLFTPEQQRMLMPSISSESHDLVRSATPLLENLDRAQNLDPINRVSYLEARCYMLNTLLRDSDVMSMAHGLEVRVPLIDHRLAQSVLRLPGKWKLDGTTPKPLLVRALRGQLPDKIVHRKKRGFTMPFDRWMRDILRPRIEASINTIGEGPLGALINEEAARNVWDDFLNGRTSWSRPWSLYVLQNWCQKHLSS